MENKEMINLTDDQILLLQSSDRDIEHDRLIAHEQLDEDDLQWLKEQ